MGRQRTRKAYLAYVTMVPLLIIDDLGDTETPQAAAEDLVSAPLYAGLACRR